MTVRDHSIHPSRLALALLMGMVGCLSYTSSVDVASGEGAPLCDAAEEVSERLAREFGLRGGIRAGDPDSELPSGRDIIASYIVRTMKVQADGFLHQVHITVFAEPDCRTITFAITDYDSGEATEYVKLFRKRLLELLRERAPDARIEQRESVLRVLPP